MENRGTNITTYSRSRRIEEIRRKR